MTPLPAGSPLPLLQVRARENMPENEIMVVEVWRDDELVGQLPATRVVYEKRPDGFGRLQVDLTVKQADIGTMP